MNKKILIVSIIIVVILALSSLGVIAYTSEETPFASSESSVVLGNLPRVEEEIHYYNPDTLTLYISGTGTPPMYWFSGVRLTQDELTPYEGWNLTKVKVRVNCDIQPEIWARLVIWGEGTATQPGNIIYEDNTLYFYMTGFHLIELDTPIALDQQNEIWITIEWEQTEDSAYILFNDEGPAIPQKGDWVSQDGGASWQELRNFALDYNWAIGAIVEGKWKSELSIINISGPIGVNAEVKNIGEIDANNLEYTMTVTGGILGGINRTVNGSKTKLAVYETEPISSGLLLGFGPISITVTADADNAYEVSTLKTGFIIGPFVFGIK